MQVLQGDFSITQFQTPHSLEALVGGTVMEVSKHKDSHRKQVRGFRHAWGLSP